ncbi:MAG: OmpA family protein [Lewinellaceae bacterium]|nr:OmpA family protein [Lewinellaceae bacterium]
MRKTTRTLLLLCGVILPVLSFGQIDSMLRWEGGLILGGNNYMGDVVESNGFLLMQTELAGGVFIRHRITPNLGIRLQVIQGRAAGDDRNNDDPGRKQRGYSFSTPLTEVSLLLEWDILGRQRIVNGNPLRRWSPFLYAGIGRTAINPKPDFGNPTNPDLLNKIQIDLRRDLSSLIAVPLGAGVHYDLSRQWSLSAEAGIRPIFSDYLDGISLAANPAKDDYYLFGGLALGYRFLPADRDGDGIPDSQDLCPELPGPTALNGCPDTDGDGLIDPEDDCPLLPGLAERNGCPDRDNDGLVDPQDKCPDQAGPSENEGCPWPDRDKDGIIDREDDCPDEPGSVQRKGCPEPDADQDGIPDGQDVCPNTPGIARFNGCPDTDGDGLSDLADACPNDAGPISLRGCPDTDGDGLIDREDRCPTEAGPASNRGCPEVTETVREKLRFITQNVFFATNSDQLQEESLPVLDQVVQIMQEYPSYHLQVNGHTDNIGDREANLELSRRRAAACVNYLQRKGINQERLHSAGFGSQQPIATNDTPAGRRVNRRVEFNLFLPEN